MRSNSRNFFNKFYKRLSAFLKLKKYKKISFHRSLIKKGLSARKTFKYNGLRYQYHLNKNIIRQIAQGVTNSTTHVPVGQNSTTILTPFDIVLRKDMSNLSAKEILDDKLDLIITKKKGGILSYLHSVFCRYPKKYMYRFLGREIYRKYYTMPYRLSVNRYVSYLIFKNYYGIGSARILKRKNGGKQNAVRRIVESTEQRLDSSVLRVLLYKPCFTYKTLSNQRKNVPNALKVKSP